MDWIDRITGERRDAPATPFVPGQWRFVGEGYVRIRGAEARFGDCLLPEPDGRCHASSLGLVRCDPHFVADQDDLRILKLKGDSISTLETMQWDEWKKESPLQLGLNDDLVETSLEQAIAETPKGNSKSKFGSLQDVCERPRTDLRIDEERLLVVRCKRPSPRASAVLAAHPADWERRTLWGVEPRRVLSFVRDDLFDIYENRIAVALVDNLDIALLRRLRAVSRVLTLHQQTEDYQHLLELDGRSKSNYRRADRILNLWGTEMENRDEQKRDIARNRWIEIGKLRRKVLALKGSPLYRNIGYQRSLRLQLRMTNVLDHDDNYRRVADLWIEWENYFRNLDMNLEPDVRWRQEQDAAAGFERFLFLVIVRALDSLRFKPSEATETLPLGAEGEWKLDGPVGSIVLRRDSSGVSVHTEHQEEPLKFVSVPAKLEAGVAVSEWLKTVEGRFLVIAALPADEPKAPAEVRVRLRMCGGTSSGGPLFVAVAPWDLESVERVARILRWYAWSALFARYPFTVELPASWNPPASIPQWLNITDRDLQVIRPLRKNERAGWSDLSSRIASATDQRAKQQRDFDACAPKNRNRLRLKNELETAIAEERAVQRVADSVCDGLAFLDLLRECPVCGKQSRASQFDNSGHLFRSSCEDCGASWGQRKCDACDGSFPFLAFPGNDPSEDLLDVDRRYGADVLAIPIAEQVFLCTQCGQRSDGVDRGSGDSGGQRDR